MRTGRRTARGRGGVSADRYSARFFDAGRAADLVARQESRRLAALDIVAQRFVPGVRYTELEVNRELIGLYPDYVLLRRELVDAGLMDRAGGMYWRSGGTVEV